MTYAISELPSIAYWRRENADKPVEDAHIRSGKWSVTFDGTIFRGYHYGTMVVEIDWEKMKLTDLAGSSGSDLQGIYSLMHATERLWEEQAIGKVNLDENIWIGRNMLNRMPKYKRKLAARVLGGHEKEGIEAITLSPTHSMHLCAFPSKGSKSNKPHKWFLGYCPHIQPKQPPIEDWSQVASFTTDGMRSEDYIPLSIQLKDARKDSLGKFQYTEQAQMHQRSIHKAAAKRFFGRIIGFNCNRKVCWDDTSKEEREREETVERLKEAIL